MNTINYLDIEISVVYEDPRYPLLVLKNDNGGTVGYSMNTDTMELERVCVCSAHSDSECVCGAWDRTRDFEDWEA